MKRRPTSTPQQLITKKSKTQRPQLSRSMPLVKESGYVDLAAAVYAGNTTGTIALIATIGQGTTVNTRVGKKAMIKSIQIRGSVSADSSTTTAKASFMIIYDKRPTGSVPAITDILDTASANSFNNDNNSSRFITLRRWDYYVIGNNVTAGQNTGATGFSIDEFIQVNRQIVFNALGTGAIADIDQGALYVISVGDNAAGVSDANFNMGFRTRFVDF